jgi:hypothetical protein
MSGGADPFSILNRDPNRSLWKLPEKKMQVNRYRSGVRPELAGEQDDSSSSDGGDIFDDSSDQKSKITHFTNKSKTTVNSQNSKNKPDAMTSQIISKNTKTVIPNFKTPDPQSSVIKKSGTVSRRSKIPTEVPPKKVNETVLNRPENVEVAPLRAGRRNVEQLIAEKNQEPSDNSGSDTENFVFGAKPDTTSNPDSDNDDTNLGKRANPDPKSQSVNPKESDPTLNPDTQPGEPSEDQASSSEDSEDDYQKNTDPRDARKVLFRPTFVSRDDRITLQKQLEDELKAELEDNKKLEEIKKANKVIGKKFFCL